jgi:hypothetical protein
MAAAVNATLMCTVSPTLHIMQGTCRSSCRLKRQNEDSTLISSLVVLDIRAKGGRSTNADDVEYFLRSMDKSAGGEGDDYHISIKVLSKNEARLTV